jgi:hypothetical protein
MRPNMPIQSCAVTMQNAIVKLFINASLVKAVAEQVNQVILMRWTKG